MARSSTFQLTDKAVGGGLRARIQTARDEGKSYLDIAYELRDEDIHVSPSTIQRWCHELGIATAATA